MSRTLSTTAPWCCASTRVADPGARRTQPLLAMRPWQVERRSHDHQRHGTTSLFAALDIAIGRSNSANSWRKSSRLCRRLPS
jgi:hypothetical protein